MPTPEYTAWKMAQYRCYNSKSPDFPRYGGRGIKMCDRWLHGERQLSGFECFLKDMGKRPTKSHTLDRYPNNDGNYEPNNCRWATMKQQQAHGKNKPYPAPG